MEIFRVERLVAFAGMPVSRGIMVNICGPISSGRILKVGVSVEVRVEIVMELPIRLPHLSIKFPEMVIV